MPNPLNSRDLQSAIESGLKSSDDYWSQKQRANDALKQLLQGKQADQQNEMAKLAEQESIANRQAQQAIDYAAKQSKDGRRIGVTFSPQGASITQEDKYDPIQQLLLKREVAKPQLTPAQTEAEKKAGDAIATYQVNGGGATMDKNQTALGDVENDLQGKRDWYDRLAGRALSGMPGVFRALAPTEKARMDKAQGTALANIRATDSNPTQVLIDQTMSRAYDPKADDASNLARIQAIKQEAEAKRKQIEQAKQNYDQTGYATIGGGSFANPKKPGVSGLTPQEQAELDQLRKELQR